MVCCTFQGMRMRPPESCLLWLLLLLGLTAKVISYGYDCRAVNNMHKEMLGVDDDDEDEDNPYVKPGIDEVKPHIKDDVVFINGRRRDRNKAKTRRPSIRIPLPVSAPDPPSVGGIPFPPSTTAQPASRKRRRQAKNEKVETRSSSQCKKKIVLKSSSGTISSPGFGTSYGINLRCGWLVKGTRNQAVMLTFRNFSLEESKYCKYDSLKLYDGNSRNAPFLGSYCGSLRQFSVLSTTNTLFLFLLTDVSKGDLGFRADYNLVTRSSRSGVNGKFVCSLGPIQLKGPNGTFTSPDYPRYPDDTDCTWLIDIQDPNRRVHLLFHDFDLEDTDSCTRDYIKVFDGPGQRAPLIGMFCGTYVDPEITASTHQVLLVLHTDESKTGRGFKVDYSSKPLPIVLPPPSKCGKPEVLSKKPRIIGGLESSPHAWPWLLDLRLKTAEYGEIHYCAGTVIHEDWLLTAGHCTVRKTDSGNVIDLLASPELFIIVSGDHVLGKKEGTEIRHRVTKIVRHEHFKAKSFLNDIALMKVDPPFRDRKETKRCCLPNLMVSPSTMCFVVGWGGYSQGGILKEIQVPVISHHTCSSSDYYGDFIKPGMFCAGYEKGGKDACQGDSGGPLVCLHSNQYAVHGVISWGFGCGREKRPGVYTTVSYYNAWIVDVIDN